MNWHDIGIEIPNNSSGNLKVRCPKCTPHLRKDKNKQAKDLSVNVSEGIYQCWNDGCGWSGKLNGEAQSYVVPKEEPKSSLSDTAISWFKKRGISLKTLQENSISQKSSKITPHLA